MANQSPLTNSPTLEYETDDFAEETNIDVSDADSITAKQDTIEILLDRGELKVAMALHKIVNDEIEGHCQLLFAKKVRQVNMALQIHQRAKDLFNENPWPPAPLMMVEFDKLYAKAVDSEAVSAFPQIHRFDRTVTPMLS
ncbi:hypothetical protein ABW21_db0204380 [Orbilia brochopaga]|nr:hypothetical protein ABW21_db0204380 [Drechslerella brochopaga]